MSSQSASRREPISASEIFPSVDSQALNIPQGAPTLTYQSLTSSTSFRLLQILSNGGQDILRCRMFDADLAAQETPRYIALSYTWHEETLPKTFRPVLINDKYLNVSLNLWNFLQNYRETAGERIIWIDQICINQEDKDECVQQIGQMCEIYQRASMDLFWIGEPDEDTEAVLDLLSSLDRLETHLLESGGSHPGISALLNPIFIRSVGLPEHDAPIWASLMKFISRSAFHRAWIIQEVAVSRKPAIFCGLLMLPFDVVGRAATFLVESSWIKLFHKIYKVSGAAGFITGMMNCRVRHQEGEHQSLDLLLASTRRFKATKPVDKIFALINLAESGRKKALPPALRPDYRKSVVEVFRDVTLHLIRQGSLDILSGVEDAKFRQIHQLPSWVPDYSVHQVASILCMPPRPGSLSLYAAAAGRDVSVQHSPSDPDTLTLSAYKIDKISKICPIAEKSIYDTLEKWASMVDFSAVYPIVNGKSGSMIDAFWRTLIGNIGLGTSHYPVSEDWVYKFAAFALQAREELQLHFSSSADTQSAAVESPSLTPGIDSVVRLLQDLHHGKEGLDQDGGLYESTMHHVSWHRRMFLTNGGYLGLAHPSTQPGDEVILLSGGRVPFVVKRGSGDRPEGYSIVGEAYFRAQVAGESPGNIGRIFVIQEQTVRDLKDKLTCTRLNDSKHQPSTFTCLAAITWAHVTNARIASLSSETSLAEDARLMISVDWRRRIPTDSISPSSGNAIALPITSIDKSTILAACNEDEETGYPALEAIANSIDEAILSVDDDFVAARTALFRKVPDPRFIGLDFDLGGPLDFYLNTWRHFGTRTHWDLPGLDKQDLARGVAPDAVRRAQVGFGTGAGLVLPETDTTKFEVLITLDVEAMEDLCNSTSRQRWVAKPGL
ncbi:Chloramphenicol acetyltransferase-like domain superfamily [Fusarium oxysporum f. sp. vasinfectum]|nr:Chloramphenicol acetyltransferase-like domain superfamily [Fusarium oxysporum f. sp. vasinfectum]